MLDFIKEISNDLNKYVTYITESLETFTKKYKKTFESVNPDSECFNDFCNYVKDNSSIKPLDHVKRHEGKKDNYLLFGFKKS